VKNENGRSRKKQEKQKGRFQNTAVKIMSKIMYFKGTAFY